MASTTAIKFYKGNYGSAEALNLSTQNVGGIVFDNTSHQIFVGGVAYGGSITDVTFDRSVLTITKATGGNITLDFSDTASASATFEVFQKMNQILGVSTNTESAYLDYDNTNYLEDIDTLVGADKVLDARIRAINDRIGTMDASNIETVAISSSNGDVTLTFKGVSETDGVVEAGTRNDNITIKKVAFTGKAEDVAIDDTNNKFTATNVESALEELKDAITGANITIDGHKGAITTDSNTMEEVAADGGKIGVKTDNVYIGSSENGVTLLHVDTDASSTTGSDLATVNTVTAHISTTIDALDVSEHAQAEVDSDNKGFSVYGIKEENGKIAKGSSKVSLKFSTVYDATNNPIALKSDVDDAVAGLGVTGYAQASVSGSTITVYGIKEENGKIDHDNTNDVTIALGSTYNANTNKVALQSNITDAINALDTTADVVPVTASDTNTQIKLTLKGIKEENGVIADGTTISTVTFSTVAATGAAADVSITDAGNYFDADNVNDALQELGSDVAAMVGGMRYNGDINSATATLNSLTNDIRPGDIYLASGAFNLDGTSVEAGDMIVYKGTQSSSDVALTSSNCSVIEKESDTMVVSGTTLTAGGLVIGSDNKEVNISTITETNLLAAMANANSALQSIGTGTDGAHVTTTVTAKENNTQNVSVALTESTVTFENGDLTATDGVLTDDAIAPIKSYIGSQIEALDVDEATVGSNVQITYSETDGKVTINSTENYATIGTDLSVTNPNYLVRGFDIGTVKDYIDSRIGSGFDSLDSNGFVQATNGNIRFEYDETNGIVTIGTMTETYATVEGSGSTTTEPSLTVSGTTTGLVKGTDISTVKTYVDNKVGYEINQLDSIGTSDDAAVARVEVVETDGKISDVIVTNINAGVSYTAASGNDPANLTFSTATGAVTGNDITAIKNYVDAKAEAEGAVVDTLSTVVVNGNQTQIATVGGQAINTAVSLVWDQYV